MNPSAVVVTTAAAAARQVLPPVLENRPLLRCEPEYGALVCLTCNNGFPRNPIARHLNERHGFTIDLYRPALRPFEHEALAQDWGDLVRPPDESAPIEGLKAARPGFACTGCGHKTVSERIAGGHLKCGGQVRRVHLQRWNTRGDCEYWIVTPPPTTAAATAAATTTANGSCLQAGMFLLRFTLFFFFFFLMKKGHRYKTSLYKTCCNENVNWRKKNDLVASSQMARTILRLGESSQNGGRHLKTRISR